MSPDQLTTYLDYLNRIDRAIGVSKKDAYEACDAMRAMLIGSVENTTSSAADTWAMAQLSSALGTMNPDNEKPGTGAWNFGVNTQIAHAEQKLVGGDDTIDD